MIKEKLQKNFRILAFVFIIFLIITKFIEYLEKDPKLNYRFTYWAMPIAISYMLDHDKNYTGYHSVREKIKNEVHLLDRKNLNDIFQKTLLHEAKDPNAFGVSNDDLGVVDLSYLSFKIFGVNKDSIDFFLISILILSSLIFYLTNYKKKNYINFLLIYLISLYAGFEILVSAPAGKDIFYGRLNDARLFSIFAIIPLVNIYSYFKSNIDLNILSKTKIYSLILISLQIYIFGLICFARSSIKIEFLILFLLFFFLYLKKIVLIRNFKQIVNLYRSNIINVFLIISLISSVILSPLINTKLIARDGNYGDHNQSSHTIFEMIRAGILLDNPQLTKKYKFDWTKDFNIERTLVESGKYFYEDILNKQIDEIYFEQGGKNIVKMEKLEREFIIYLLFNDFKEVIKSIFYYKPLKMIQALKKHYNEINKTDLIPAFLMPIILFFNRQKHKSISEDFEIPILIIIPVVVKNLLFWGLVSNYFVDLFILLVCFIIYIIFNLWKFFLSLAIITQKK